VFFSFITHFLILKYAASRYFWTKSPVTVSNRAIFFVGYSDGGDESLATPNQSDVYGGGTVDPRRAVANFFWGLFGAISA
jgi:hypothetical protein